MRFNTVLLVFANAPKKFMAIIVFFIMLVLFFCQLSFYLYYYPDTHDKILLQDNKTKVINITAASPLFTIPLFGTVASALADMEIKPSSLDLEVAGILYSPNKKGSQVLIRAAGKEEQSYVIGDQLPGGAVIKQIKENEVLVLYRGALESLSLPKNDLLFDEPAKPLIQE